MPLIPDTPSLTFIPQDAMTFFMGSPAMLLACLSWAKLLLIAMLFGPVHPTPLILKEKFGPPN